MRAGAAGDEALTPRGHDQVAEPGAPQSREARAPLRMPGGVLWACSVLGLSHRQSPGNSAQELVRRGAGGASCENGARDGGLRDQEGARPHTLKVPEHRTPNTEAIRENPSAERG